MGSVTLSLLPKILKNIRNQPREPRGATTSPTPGNNDDVTETGGRMALAPRSPGEDPGKYVSVVTNEDFNNFQQNGYHDEEEIDFTPQNGYMEPDEMEWEEEPRESKGPKLNMMDRLAAAGT